MNTLKRKLFIRNSVRASMAFLTAFCLLVACGPLLQAQSTDKSDSEKREGNIMTFDVASVKLVPVDDKIDTYQYKFAPGGRLTIRHFRVRDLIMIAWHLRDFEIEGPNWISRQGAYYDIDAEAAGNPTDAQMRLMLQSLLEDRFHLAAHMANKVEPQLALRRNGSIGSGVNPTKHGSCTPLADYGTQAPLPVAPAGTTPYCGFKARLVELEDRGSAERFEWHGMPMANVARVLGTELRREVNDDTGLSGSYDVTLEFRPGDFWGGPPPPGAAESTAPSLFAAVQDQLGLKLVSERGPVQVLVIDHVEPPTPN